MTDKENLGNLEDLGYIIGDQILRISGAVKILEAKNVSWVNLLKGLTDDQLEIENKLYDDVASASNNFLEILTYGLEAVNFLESKQVEVADAKTHIKAKINGTVTQVNQSQSSRHQTFSKGKVP